MMKMRKTLAGIMITSTVMFAAATGVAVSDEPTPQSGAPMPTTPMTPPPMAPPAPASPPSAPADQAFPPQPPLPSELAPVGPTLSLDQVLRTSLAYQHEREALVVDEAKTRLQSAEALRLPTVSTVSRVNISSSSAVTDVPGSGNNFYGERARFGVVGTVPVYDSGLISDEIRSARDSWASTQLNTQSTDRTTADTVTAAYYSVIKAQQDLADGNDTLDETQAHLVDAQTRLKLGSVTLGDVLTAQSATSKAQANIKVEEYNLLAARAQLAVLMGTDPFQANFQLASPPGQPILTQQAQELYSRTLSTDPGMQKLNYDLDASRAGLKAVKASYSPSIHLSVEAGVSASERTDNGTSGVNGGYALASVGLALPIFESRQKKAEEKDQQDQIALKLLDISDYRNQLRQQIVDESSEYAASSAEVDAATEAVASEEEAFRLAKQRYIDGVGTQIDVLTAVENLSSARDGLSSAQFDLDQLAAKLSRQIGDEQVPAVPLNPQK